VFESNFAVALYDKALHECQAVPARGHLGARALPARRWSGPAPNGSRCPQPGSAPDQPKSVVSRAGNGAGSGAGAGAATGAGDAPVCRLGDRSTVGLPNDDAAARS